MQQITTEAIILDRKPFRGSSIFIDVLSPDAGRISAVAHGAKRSSSKFGGEISRIARCTLQLQKNRGDLYTLSAAHMNESFEILRTSLTTLATASYFFDCVRLSSRADSHSLYELLLSALRRLCLSCDGQQMRSHIVYFELMLLDALGIAPSLDTCINCGVSYADGGRFSARGGFVCAVCSKKYNDGIVYTQSMMHELQHLRSGIAANASLQTHGVLHLSLIRFIGAVPPSEHVLQELGILQKG